jgi:hypothetical protein
MMTTTNMTTTKATNMMNLMKINKRKSQSRATTTIVARCTDGDAPVTTMDRRSFVRKAAGAAIAAIAVTTRPAYALIPANDEDDEAFLAKARENRANRIQSEVAKQGKYVNETGLKQDAPTAKIQLAVYKLSKSGGQISSGNLAEAASELDGGWTGEVESAAKELGADGREFTSSVGKLRDACANGDSAAAKSAYRASAAALKALAQKSGVAEKLRLL